MSPRLIALIGSFALALPAITSAQFTGTGTPFTLSVTPQSPAPYGRVTITPISGQIDVANATEVMTTNGKEVYRGNAGAVSLTLGSSGVVTNIVVRLTSAGKTYSQTLSLAPQDVQLIIEPIASTPPLYPGKPLVPLGGSVRAVAIADLRTGSGKRLDPAVLSYVWTVDGVEQTGASGIGKQVAIIDSPLQYRSSTVEVTVASQDGALSSGAALDIVANDPTVRIYERDPLLGIRFERALGSAFAISGSEATLYGAPFSFPTALGAPLLQWFVNGTLSQTGSLLTLRPTGSGKGTASLTLSGAVGDVSTASTDLTVTFGTHTSSTIFGL